MSGSSSVGMRALRVALAGALCLSLLPGVAVGRDGARVPVAGRVKAPAGASVDANGYPYVEGELIVRFGSGVSAAAAQALHAKSGAAVIAEAEGVPGLQRVKLPKGVGVESAVTRYQQAAGVEYAQPNYIYRASVVPNDARFSELWGMHNEGQTGGMDDADIDAPEAWDVQTGSDAVVVAVIDTGVDYNHPDLADNIWTNPGEIPGNGLDDDGNGYIDDVHGYDFFNYDSDPMDDYGHGTHCSGTIGAVGDDGIGVAGVAWDVTIMPVKFLSADGFGDTWGAVESIYYADMMGADIMSNSWGGGPWEQVLYDAIASTDALFVAAAGNWSENTDLSPNYPSCYDLPNVLAVGATDHNDQMAWFSNWGPETVDVFAPGDEVLSTIPGTLPTFEPDVLDGWTVSTCDDLTDWDVSMYESNAWALTDSRYVSDPYALAHLGYANKENSWAYLTDPIDLSGLTAPALRFSAYYETEPGFDILHAWVSSDGADWIELASRSGWSEGFETIDCDLSGYAGDATVYLAFSFTSDTSIDSKDGFLGAIVDDIEVIELDSYLTEDFSDLSAWDASGYSVQPWDLTTAWYTSAPSAAGVIDYTDDVDATLELAAPIDLSGAAGDLALMFNAFYYTDPGLDIMSVLASTDGSTWTTLDTFSGFSGIWEPGFIPALVDLTPYAGESAVYLAFRFVSDGQWSSADGLIGVAVDDVVVAGGTWQEADYADAYALMGGTSMATPHVSGIAALTLAEWPGVTAVDLKNAVMKGADPLPQLEGMCVTGARANAYNSLQDLFGPVVTDDNTGLYVGRAEIALEATDDSGVASISYAFDDDEPTTVAGAAAVAVNTVPAKSHTLTYWGEDDLGNVSDPVTVEFELRRGEPASVPVAGADRFATSVEASKKAFPDGADTVVIATGRNWPDALGGTALAGVVDGPILLTDTAILPGGVAAEVERLGAGRAYVLGGASAVAPEVVTELVGIMGPGSVTRLAGDDRYETAAKIADEVIALQGTVTYPEAPDVPSSYDGMVFVATGANYPDALAAAPLAAHRGWPIVLADPAGSITMPEDATDAMILGGESVVSSGMEAALTGFLGEGHVMRRGGADRYATAALVAAFGVNRGLHWEGVGIATGASFADALAGGAMLGRMRSPLLLTPGDALSVSAKAPLSVNRASIQTVHFIGGTSVISDAVRTQAMSAID